MGKPEARGGQGMGGGSLSGRETKPKLLLEGAMSSALPITGDRHPVSLRVTQWAGWVLSGGGCRGGLGPPSMAVPAPGSVALMLLGCELHPRALL